MNKKELNQAVKAYGETILADVSTAIKQMLSDGYTDQDVSDIIKAVEAPAPPAKGDEPAQQYFSEVEVKITRVPKEDGGSEVKIERLRTARKKVGITQEEADTLNAGVQNGDNTYASMYFPAE